MAGMCDVDVHKIASLMQMRHSSVCAQPEGHGDRLAAPYKVSEVAHKLACRYYFGDADGDSGLVNVVRVAGLMIYAIERYGMAFQSVCDLADLEVARSVAELTHDQRLPEGLRKTRFPAQIGNGGSASQLVKLAEIGVIQRRVISTFSRDQLRERATRHWLRGWVEEAGAVLDAMHTIRAHKELATWFADCRRGLEQVTKRVEEARQKPQATVGELYPCATRHELAAPLCV
jgi:hypothetical protein